MSRTIEAGGGQGRGNPPATRRETPLQAFAAGRLRSGDCPDRLALAVACHVGDATPDIAMNPHNRWGGNLVAWWLVADGHLRRLRGAA